MSDRAQNAEKPRSSAPSPAVNSECLSDDLCRSVCEGTAEEVAALHAIRHASRCIPCAEKLNNLARVLDVEITPEETLFLALLPSSTQRGASDLAARMATAHPSTRRNWWDRARAWQVPSIAFAGTCLIVMAWMVIGRMHTDQETKWFSAAYDAARPSELRVPGSTPGDLASVARGGSVTSSSTALLEWKLSVQRRFEKDPNNASTRRQMGEIALVESDPKRAVDEFEMARVLDHSLPYLSFDLAAAHFEIAEATDQRMEFYRAIELFSQYLRNEGPRDPVALFDRALGWERVGATDQASADFRAALANETNVAWRAVIQQQLSALRSAPRSANPPNSPPVADPSSDEEFAYEPASDAAIRLLLPQRDHATPAQRSQLERLVDRGRRHGDLWLVEMLGHPPSEDEINAEHALASAMLSYQHGDLDTSLRAARKAQQIFHATRNETGFARASLQTVYAQQGAGKVLPCITEAENLERLHRIEAYPRIQVQVWLELSACYSMRGDAQLSLEKAEQALLAARVHSLPVAALRAAGFLVVDELELGRLEAAARIGSDALHATVGMPDAAVQRYQLLNDMEDIARRARLSSVLLGFSEEAAEQARESQNVRAYAYALEDLGTAQLQDDDLSGARHSFELADHQLSILPSGPSIKLYRADWQADRAPLLFRSLGLPGAVHAFAEDEIQFAHFAMVLPRVRFYTEFSALLRQQGDFSASIEKASQAIGSLGRSLELLESPASRRSWLRSNRRTYQVLIADLIDSGQPARALNVWRWLHSAPYLSQSEMADPSIELRERGTISPRDDPPALRLAYARLEDRYVVWASPAGRPIQTHVLSARPTDLEFMIHVFANLCADPSSSRNDLQQVGERLSSILLSPVQREIDRSSSIDLAVDDELLELPFTALSTARGYFGLQHTLRFELSGPPRSPYSGPTAGSFRKVLLLRGVADPLHDLPKAWDETVDLARLTSASVEPVRLTHLQGDVALSGSTDLAKKLRSAEIIHYAGHGLDGDPRSGMSTVVALMPGTLPRCWIAVLAACRTFGEREDDVDRVSSVAGVFLRAGAERVLAARWDVDSRITRKLMLDFYNQLTRSPPEQALQFAMQAVRSDSATSHPYFWAPFEVTHPPSFPLIGDPLDDHLPPQSVVRPR